MNQPEVSSGISLSQDNNYYDGLAVVSAAAEKLNMLSKENRKADGCLEFTGRSGASTPSPGRQSPREIGSNTPTSSASSSSAGQSAVNRKKGVPYIPSYMDLTNGPEPCVVCGDAATGYHYRCMTCEGCKGFFRRTIQKNLQYQCKYNQNCAIDKNTRNQCQECRFRKCVTVGMATDLVLNERQRVAKRKLIEENRERRHAEAFKKSRPEGCEHERDEMTDADKSLIADIVNAFHSPQPKKFCPSELEQNVNANVDPLPQSQEAWNSLAEVITPSVLQVVDFAKNVPGFSRLNIDDQILLLRSCCMEIMCLRAAGRYDPETQALIMPNGMVIHHNQAKQIGVGFHAIVEPIFEFAAGLAKLQLDQTEVALLAGVLLMQSDRSGLKNAADVEKLQDSILGAFKHYVAEKRPCQPLHWAKILMKVTDIRTISTRHADRVLSLKVDEDGAQLPPLILGLFGDSYSCQEKEINSSHR